MAHQSLESLVCSSTTQTNCLKLFTILSIYDEATRALPVSTYLAMPNEPEANETLKNLSSLSGTQKCNEDWTFNGTV